MQKASHCIKDNFSATRDTVFNPVEWRQWTARGEHTPVAARERIDALKMRTHDHKLLGLSKNQIDQLLGSSEGERWRDVCFYSLNRANCGNAESLLSVLFKDAKVSEWAIRFSGIYVSPSNVKKQIGKVLRKFQSSDQ